MYDITIRLRSIDLHSEVPSDDLDTAEMMIENIVSQAVLELFHEVSVLDVIVRLIPNGNKHGELALAS